MKDKVLRLCKRLKNCTLNDIVQFTEAQEVVIETMLLFLEQEGLIQINNGIITPAEPKNKDLIDNKNLDLMFQHRTAEEREIIIKGFCLLIPPQKLSILVNTADDCICNYYAIFRKKLYELQFKKLLSLFIEKPQIGRYRRFYEKKAFFYVYNNQVFVSEKLLRGNWETEYTKNQIREFKRMYCYLSRVESHNVNEKYMYYRLAEYIWRHEKNYETLYKELKEII